MKQLKYIDYELIETKERELANEEHKDEMGQAENADGNDPNADNANSIDAELRDAKIECTNDIFGRVLDSLDEETRKLRLFQKFSDA